METLYELLGALPNDNAGELRAAFRRAVKGAHPDLRPDDPDAGLKFRRIVRANEMLGDAEQRAAYDHLLGLAHHEHHERRKLAAAARLHKLATGAMALTAIASMALGGSALFLQLSAHAALPAIPGNMALADPAPVASTAAKAGADALVNSPSIGLFALAVEPPAGPAPAASAGPPLDILPILPAAEKHRGVSATFAKHGPSPNNGIAANRIRQSKPKSVPRDRAETFSDRLRRFERGFAEISREPGLATRNAPAARAKRSRQTAEANLPRQE